MQVKSLIITLFSGVVFHAEAKTFELNGKLLEPFGTFQFNSASTGTTHLIQNQTYPH